MFVAVTSDLAQVFIVTYGVAVLSCTAMIAHRLGKTSGIAKLVGQLLWFIVVYNLVLVSISVLQWYIGPEVKSNIEYRYWFRVAWYTALAGFFWRAQKALRALDNQTG